MIFDVNPCEFILDFYYLCTIIFFIIYYYFLVCVNSFPLLGV